MPCYEFRVRDLILYQFRALSVIFSTSSVNAADKTTYLTYLPSTQRSTTRLTYIPRQQENNRCSAPALALMSSFSPIECDAAFFPSLSIAVDVARRSDENFSTSAAHQDLSALYIQCLFAFITTCTCILADDVLSNSISGMPR